MEEPDDEAPEVDPSPNLPFTPVQVEEDAAVLIQ